MRRIHFIGICGVAMGGLAIAFQKNGWKVTGSDVGFYPPISAHLRANGIEFYPGWHPDRVLQSFDRGGADGNVVVVGNVAGSANPEWLYARERALNYKSYPQIISEYFVKTYSIVCAGTYGKTTTTALLTWIMSRAGMNFSYMFGGLPRNDMHSARFDDKSEWIVLEGDEYKSAKWDARPKFSHYFPTHLLLTAISWDHADVYPTEASYINAFKELAVSIPPNGLTVACADNAMVMQLISNLHDPARQYNSDGRQTGLLSPVITYGKSPDADYRYSGVRQNQSGLIFTIEHQNDSCQIMSPLLGAYNAENICGCFAMAGEIGIKAPQIAEAIGTFGGVKRRIEKRASSPFVIIDDIAHSPAKAQSVLKILREIYNGKIIAIFEPNTGNRRPQAAPLYNHAFDAADEVLIPELTKIKTDPGDRHLNGKEIVDIISKTQPRVQFISDDERLVSHIRSNASQGDVAVFLGSHGFRGMIERLMDSE